MENKRISINLMLLVGIFIAIIVIMFFTIKYFKQKEVQENEIQSEQVEEVSDVNSSEIINTNTEEKNAKNSSKNKPLKVGEWGTTSKQENIGVYKDAEICVSKIIKGNQAAKMVQLWDETNGNQFKDSITGTEWVVVEYEINLKNLSMSKAGNNVSIESKIEGLGNSTSIKYDNKIYEIETLSLNKDEYTTEEVAKGRFAMQLPVNCSNYIIILGDGEQKAYIKGE